jgi:hypothetical protein
MAEAPAMPPAEHYLGSMGSRRPVWIIAHRCTHPADAESALGAGANGVECDLRFAGGAWKVAHRGDDTVALSQWLGAARWYAERYPHFTLAVIDLKTPRADIVELRHAIRDALPTDVAVLYSTASFDDRDALARLAPDLRAREGLAIDEHDEPEEVDAFFRSLAVEHAWYGNGIAVSVPEPPSIRASIERAIALRGRGAIKKGYVWTLAARDSIRTYLDEVEVDGVMVESGTFSPGVENALALVHELPALRLATRADAPFG